jgi:UDP-N-acetylglucosamine--N-acetylmuramyl-(pentapeptide) pyrophosphoryl-undecaprenol N-acetylglucosamine transferase
VAAVAFEDTARHLACPVEVTGVPVRREFGEVPPLSEIEESQAHGPLRLLVVGGSQGAEILNRTLPTVLAALRDRPRGARRLDLVHQTGRDHLDATRERYRQVGIDPDGDPDADSTRGDCSVRVMRFIDDMAEAMSASDLIVSRAGAITVAEITCASRPAIFVPLTLAEGHQRANAQALERAGAALVIEEGDDFAERLTARLDELLETPGRLAEMAERARLASKPAAASEIADLVERLGRA